ncbi:hypothetical protein [Oceanirhabdus sp. W0125-5]|uniref:hypothetical protein n=1 Tax=Oceanirhabdus sp. W0125-5 TaxID=2999116 RepID=UPI0022F2B2AD|nr:hypothetical protein [Oceanirhabdus sp. W0125-5]WBW97890.1 hypothetical protein OW730_03670 [Oceanirhabdus sp. W0125-5]
MEKRGALIIGVSIIIGFLILGLLLKSPIESLGNKESSVDNQISELSNSISELNRYQIISANDNNIIFLDTKTGEYWTKFIPSNKGSTGWMKESGPDLNR